ncbi:MAG: 4-hydroxythreonine-4-phosphate dehydrogenase PdxA [Chloroherpetonaceae bacterium]|nr:4-hydroxythreonine-4-phosphate dehydrogenase PdxA [Chloroherpetonaceae bacterium]MCS7210451.1 4-hydroxythreonine-4-phosphate dehydrogenase PdxA [Chloroherpetonaceae bacterium]MDW8018857.1 4-hydroxythreonine-4-phosphate dehydrogenase PdxA [Chloroherpetonaceae bacterium]MDW8466698.1 4-hydroxythreonine-4-phosphate dehydrogenase PdxA [Chloroherpetonaceae bacterium]
MRILWTHGDANGIGPEILLKAFKARRQSEHCYIVVGSYCVMKFYAKELGFQVPIEEIHSLDGLPLSNERLYVLSLSCPIKMKVGTVQADAGALSMQAIETAAKLCLAGKADAMVTAPIHKEAIQAAGYAFQGHTDFLEFLCRKEGYNAKAQMILADRHTKLRVALATVHVPLREVSETLRASGGLRPHIASLVQALRRDFGIRSPKIAVLGLNPHSSDNGVIGREEVEWIQPELDALKKEFEVSGVFAADGFFGAKHYKHFDAVLALYHDQGLIPFKMLAFETGVNVTAGLPIVRTSPDHGTAFDIAGKGIANPKSVIEATYLAEEIAEARRQMLTQSHSYCEAGQHSR